MNVSRIESVLGDTKVPHSQSGVENSNALTKAPQL